MKYAARTIFQNNEMLRHLDAAGMDRVGQVATRRSFAKGVLIFAEGDPGDAIFGVIAGQVHIMARTPANQQIFLNLVGPGGVFGEIAVVDGLARCVTAVAATERTPAWRPLRRGHDLARLCSFRCGERQYRCERPTLANTSPSSCEKAGSAGLCEAASPVKRF